MSMNLSIYISSLYFFFVKDTCQMKKRKEKEGKRKNGIMRERKRKGTICRSQEEEEKKRNYDCVTANHQ